MCKEGFMKSMWSCRNNKLMLSKLMQDLDKNLDLLSMKVAHTHLNLSLEMDSKLDKITAMMEKMAQSGSSKSDPAEMDPKLLAELAESAGMKTGEAIKRELGAMSTKMESKMDEIEGHVRVCVRACVRVYVRVSVRRVCVCVCRGLSHPA